MQMFFSQETAHFISNAWKVFLLFLIPIGGGIPAGVVLAQSQGLSWIAMSVLYFLSDVVLACLFEPFMLLVIYASGRYEALAKISAAFKKAMNKTIARYGVNPSPFKLVMIAFGVDPMTGRAAALAAGHGFFTGWAIAILGDLVFFFILMISTLFLSNILGDGTMAAVIIMVAMMVIPEIVKRIQKRRAALS